MAFTGITFSRQKIAPSDDAIVRRAMLQDGALVGCGFSYVGSSLIWASGQLILCGRQIRHTSEEVFTLDGATTGFARVVISIDLTRTATTEAFDQVYTSIDYAQTVAGFPQLLTEDINGNGSVYQFPLAVVSLAPGGITGIVSKLEETSAGGDGMSTIIVAAEPGSIVTCSDGTITKTAGESGGTWTFRGCGIGTWTVTATKNGDTTTATVPIQYETQRLRYHVLLCFFYATITASFPAGSTCTCSSGGTTLTSDGTTGTYSFTIPFAGAWTVTCTDGSDTASAEVIISEDGQEESVTLEYKLWLYKDGDLCGRQWRAEAKPMSQNSGSAQPSIAYNADSVSVSINNQQSGTYKGGIFYLSDKVDLTEYSTLKMEYDKTGKTFYLQVWPSIGSYGTQNREKYVQLSDGTNNTATIDVSSLSGEKFVGMCFESSGGTGTVTIKRLYLER